MPTPTQEMRKSVRVRISNGLLRILHPVMPALNCRMLDLSEGGVRCQMDINPLDEFAAKAWRQLLASGKLITVELGAPGSSQKCQIFADVRHVRLGHAGDITFGLKFHRLDSQQQEVVTRAIRAYLHSRQSFDDNAEPVQQSECPPERASTRILNTRPVSKRVEPAPKPKPQTLIGQAKSLWQDLTGPRGRPSINYRGMKIGEILMRTGRITPKQAVEAYEKSRAVGIKFGRYLISQKLVTPAELCRALSLQTGLPVVDLSSVTLPDTVKSAFPIEIMREHSFVPFNQFGPEIYIAVTLPLTKMVMIALQETCGSALKVFLAREDVISAALDSRFFDGK